MHSGSKVSSGVLSPLHFKTFRATLSRIFETTTTKLAYAQILDGTPNSTAYGEDHDTRYRDCLGETSEEAFVALEAFYSQFSPDMLLFEAKVGLFNLYAPLDNYYHCLPTFFRWHKNIRIQHQILQPSTFVYWKWLPSPVMILVLIFSPLPTAAYIQFRQSHRHPLQFLPLHLLFLVS